MASKRKHDDDSSLPEIIDPSKKQKIKKNVRFNDVTVYYFPRSQGFVSVPSQGTITLGMVHEHSYVEQYSIGDFSRHRHALHKSILRERKLLPTVVPSLTIESDDEEEEEPLPVDDYYFVQPIATRQRRLLLKQAGLVKFDATEKHELTMIRRSRETCGCSCRRDTGGCQPSSCECYLNGITCQVDRLTFPCPCATMLCRNPLGRLEFNQNRVRNHFIRTISRLEIEKQENASPTTTDDLPTIAALLSSIISAIELEQSEITSLLRSIVATIDPPMRVVVVSPPPSPPPSPIVVVNMLTPNIPSKEPITRVRRTCRTPSPVSSRSSLRRKATSRSSSTSIISAKSA